MCDTAGVFSVFRRGVIKACQNLRPAASHPFQPLTAEWRVVVEATMHHGQSRVVTLQLEFRVPMSCWSQLSRCQTGIQTTALA